MKTILNKGVSLIVFIALFSCGDKIQRDEYLNTPFLSLESTPYSFPDPPAIVVKNVLLEDFTGHKCGYCPNASRKIKTLLSMPKYADRIIPIAIYGSGSFNTYTPGADMFYYNFTTEEGDEVDKYFGVSQKSFPNGLIDRKEYENEVIIGHPKWQNALDIVLEETPVAWVDVYAKYNNTGNNYITIDTRINLLETYPNPINVNVVLIEDHIVNWQIDYSKTPKQVENYVHNHVLRYNNELHNRNLYGTWGAGLKSTNNGTDEIKRVTTTLNGTDWNVDNLYAIAYIYDANTKEILQVNKTKVSK